MESDLSDWIETIRLKINKGYDEWNMCKILSADPSIADKPVSSLLKMDEPMVAQITFDTNDYSNVSEIKTKYVKPKRLGLKINLFHVKNNYDITNISNYWNKIGQQIALMEYSYIVNSMIENAEVVQEYSTNEFESEHIKSGADKISKNGIFPYDIIVNSKDIWHLAISNKFTPIRNIPDNYIPINERGPHFLGLISYLRTHNAPFLDKIAVIYDKNEVQIATTDIHIEYEKRRSSGEAGLVGPFLYVEKTCTSEPTVNAAVSVIKMICA